MTGALIVICTQLPCKALAAQPQRAPNINKYMYKAKHHLFQTDSLFCRGTLENLNPMLLVVLAGGKR